MVLSQCQGVKVGAVNVRGLRLGSRSVGSRSGEVKVGVMVEGSRLGSRSGLKVGGQGQRVKVSGIRV